MSRAEQVALGKALQEERERAGMTQAKVAAHLGVTSTTVSRWERGEQPVKARDVVALTDLYRGVGETPRLVEMVPRGTPEPAPTAPRVMASQAARVWLADFRAELTKAQATDEEIAEAVELVTAPQVFTFFKGGAPRELSEDDAILAMDALATVVRSTLKRRGRKFPKG